MLPRWFHIISSPLSPPLNTPLLILLRRLRARHYHFSCYADAIRFAALTPCLSILRAAVDFAGYWLYMLIRRCWLDTRRRFHASFR